MCQSAPHHTVEPCTLQGLSLPDRSAFTKAEYPGYSEGPSLDTLDCARSGAAHRSDCITPLCVLRLSISMAPDDACLPESPFPATGFLACALISSKGHQHQQSWTATTAGMMTNAHVHGVCVRHQVPSGAHRGVVAGLVARVLHLLHVSLPVLLRLRGGRQHMLGTSEVQATSRCPAHCTSCHFDYTAPSKAPVRLCAPPSRRELPHAYCRGQQARWSSDACRIQTT